MSLTLLVADPGVEPRTEDYESSVIPFHQPAIVIYIIVENTVVCLSTCSS